MAIAVLGYEGPWLLWTLPIAVWHPVCIDAVDVGIGVIELGRNIVSVRVGASGTGVESRAQPKVALGDGRGFDWVQSPTVSRLSRVAHGDCRVRKG